MSDLDKLMKKLKTEKVEESTELDDEDDDTDEDDEDFEGDDPVEEETPDVTNPNHTIEGEVGVLQNDGIFRRELLLVKKEQVDVLKVIAELLISIDKNGKKASK